MDFEAGGSTASRLSRVVFAQAAAKQGTLVAYAHVSGPPIQISAQPLGVETLLDALAPLELLPLSRSLVVLAVNHMRVNLLCRPYRPCPSRADTAGSGTPLANRCEL